MNDRKSIILERLDIAAVVRELFPVVEQETGHQVKVNCPFHADDTPSMSVNTEKGLFHCFGCPAKGNIFDLDMKVTGRDFKSVLYDYEERTGITANKSTSTTATNRPSTVPAKTTPIGKDTAVPKVKVKVVGTYVYHDAEGKRRYWKKRFEPGFDGKRKKSFAAYHKDQIGKEVKGRGCDPLLYNTHKLATNPPGDPVFILEGERKADALTAWGLCATSLDSGGQSGKSKTTWRDEFNQFFQGREVYILPDNDTAGETYAATVAGRLLDIAAAVRILRLPGLPAKGDVIDWINLNQKEA
jgi:putative DNA primase/helicase